MRAIAFILAASMATACVDPDEAELDTEGTTAAAAVWTGCTGTVTTNGTLPANSAFWGFLPADVSPNQVWVIHPLDAAQTQYAMYQVDWERGRVTWRTQLNSFQRSIALVVASGRVGRVGGVRTPPPPPPPIGTDWLKFVVAYAKGVHVAFDAAAAGAPCLGTFTPAGPTPAIEPFLGFLPPDINENQVWLYQPVDAAATEYLAYQVDPVASRVAWATRLPAFELPVLVGAISGHYGRVFGVRSPPPPPPPDGTDWQRQVLGLARGGFVSYEVGQAIGGLRGRPELVAR